MGDMPEILGLSESVPTRTFDYDVSISDDFISTWLPTQAPISRISAEGDWRYDLSTMDFMAFDDGLRTPGMNYSMTAVVPDYDAVELDDAPAATQLTGTQLTELPTDLPSIIRSTATRETANLPSRFRQAVALQNFLREGRPTTSTALRATAATRSRTSSTPTPTATSPATASSSPLRWP